MHRGTKAQRSRRPKVCRHQGQRGRSPALLRSLGKRLVPSRRGRRFVLFFFFFFFKKPEPHRVFKKCCARPGHHQRTAGAGGSGRGPHIPTDAPRAPGGARLPPETTVPAKRDMTPDFSGRGTAVAETLLPFLEGRQAGTGPSLHPAEPTSAAKPPPRHWPWAAVAPGPRSPSAASAALLRPRLSARPCRSRPEATALAPSLRLLQICRRVGGGSGDPSAGLSEGERQGGQAEGRGAV